MIKLLRLFLFACVMLAVVFAYDPEDKEIDTIIPPEGTFEAFYPRETNGKTNSVSRASHNHGSFFANRNPGMLSSGSKWLEVGRKSRKACYSMH